MARTGGRTCIEEQGDLGPLQSRAPAAGAPPVTLYFGPRVSGETLALVTDALSEARNVLGETTPFSLFVHCDIEQYVAAANRPAEELRKSLNDGLTGQVIRGDVWLYGPNFDRAPPSQRRRIVYHEYFHLVQRFLSGNRSSQGGAGPPMWLIEGSARYFEFAVVQENLDTFRRTQVRRWAALPPLAELERAGGAVTTGGTGEAYTVGAVASDFLVNTYGRGLLQHDFWVALADRTWELAFKDAFGIDVEDFYAEFEAYRATLKP